ncbi:metallophosphoesterase [Thiorhodococcus mannitoliphagus]|uniref:Metallophosphoesterase n=1 Tax=Thiorhodococcus mannitoliphagus TaxID=329406 RepID=A0A6P1E3N3_9GAMM|nr:metallophosphoesterase [Thiorhodococcus mannitoliphagus]NEX23656.1 metallophosphoesterase [Thiorhodococcus mannitoliphagus]
MAQPQRISRKSFLKRFSDVVQGMDNCEDVDLRGALRLTDEKVRIPPPAVPLQLLLGGEDGYRLHLYPELRFDSSGELRHADDYLLFDPTTYFSDISGFLRLSQGDSLTLGRHDPMQRLLLRYPKVVDEKHLRLKLSNKGLAMKRKSERTNACAAPLTSEDLTERMVRWRRKKIEHLHDILGGPLEPIARSEALALIEHVIEIMVREPYRVENDHGRPSGLLALPERPHPIIIGDLHARIDNLLVILTQNGFLEALEDGSGILIILGDAIQPDAPGTEDEMDSSMLMMDLIFRLKLKFPERVFYLRGNHDSFSEEISKAGIPQGLLWEQALEDKRGRTYRDAMQQLYDHLPYVAASASYVACHAGPPTRKLSWDALTDITQSPELAHQLTHNRLRRPNFPSGYTAGDVGRMRKRLGVKGDTPVVVGHTPLSEDATYWTDAGGIHNHHVLYGADPDWVSVITRTDKKLMPLTYPTEPLLAVYNGYARTGQVTP